jgi:hypothetical protein
VAGTEPPEILRAHAACIEVPSCGLNRSVCSNDDRSVKLGEFLDTFNDLGRVIIRSFWDSLEGIKDELMRGSKRILFITDDECCADGFSFSPERADIEGDINGRHNYRESRIFYQGVDLEGKVFAP